MATIHINWINSTEESKLPSFQYRTELITAENMSVIYQDQPFEKMLTW